jgi:hypothetical protein
LSAVQKVYRRLCGRTREGQIYGIKAIYGNKS